MLKAHNQEKKWVWAWNTIRGEQYFCPACGQPLKVRIESKYKMDHFAHISLTNCTHGSGETPEHEEQKKAVFDALRTRLGDGKCGLEEPFPDGQKPDVWFESSEGIVAVEIQRSRISDIEYAERNASYATKNVASFWMICGLKSYLTPMVLEEGIASIPAWVRRLAKPYKGIAFDQATRINRADSSPVRTWEVAAVKLRPVQKISRKTDGTPFTESFFDYDIRVLDIGQAIDVEDEHGWASRRWLPKVMKGSPHQLQKKATQRRELGDDKRYAVHCSRVGDVATQADGRKTDIEKMEELIEEKYQDYMARLDQQRREIWLKQVASNLSTDNQLL